MGLGRERLPGSMITLPAMGVFCGPKRQVASRVRTRLRAPLDNQGRETGIGRRNVRKCHSQPRKERKTPSTRSPSLSRSSLGSRAPGVPGAVYTSEQPRREGGRGRGRAGVRFPQRTAYPGRPGPAGAPRRALLRTLRGALARECLEPGPGWRVGGCVAREKAAGGGSSKRVTG